MPDRDKYEMPPEQERMHQLLMKIVAYQRSLPNGRAVELDELKREGVLEPADIEFLSSNSVTYKPHRLSDYHALDMFHMPTSDGRLRIHRAERPIPQKASHAVTRLPSHRGELSSLACAP
jgi:hypothetical protein